MKPYTFSGRVILAGERSGILKNERKEEFIHRKDWHPALEVGESI